MNEIRARFDGTNYRLPAQVYLPNCELTVATAPGPRGVWIFVCLMRDFKQYCDAIKLYCAHCVGNWLAQSVQWSFVTSQH